MPRGNCTVSGCGKPHIAKGLCTKHYQKQKKHGDPLGGREHPAPGAVSAFLQDSINYQGDECIRWPFGVAGKGYGTVSIGGKTKYAHIIVCESVNGERPSENHEVAHSCGRGHFGCVTPRHLRWATHSENLLDKAMHGTSGRNMGTKLTPLDVVQIKKMAETNSLSQSRIAEMFGVCQTTVSAIKRGTRWQYLNELAGAA